MTQKEEHKLLDDISTLIEKKAQRAKKISNGWVRMFFKKKESPEKPPHNPHAKN